MKRIILIVLCLSVSLYVYAVDTYLCIMDSTVGFKYKDGDYVPVIYKAGKKYLVQRRKPGEHSGQVFILPEQDKKITWFVRELDDKFILSRCDYGPDALGDLRCSGYYQFAMNTINLRSILISKDSFTSHADKDDRKNPYMSTGKCSVIN